LMSFNFQFLLPVGIILVGLFVASVGYEAIKNKRMRLMPINREEVLDGDAAVKAGKQTIAVGLVITAVGLIFLLLP